MEERKALPFAVNFQHFLLIGNPVQVPVIDSRRIMDTENINVLDFPAARFKMRNNPTKRCTGISAWENIFVHEDTPELRSATSSPGRS